MIPVIFFKKIHENAIIPAKAHESDSGYDITSCVDAIIPPRGFKVIPTGLQMELPGGYECQVRPRSGLAAKFGVTVLNTPGTIDTSYRGEIKIILINHGTTDFHINIGDRIAQLVPQPVFMTAVMEKKELNETDRGEGGFGSTGR